MMGTEILLNQIRGYDKELIVSSMGIVLEYEQINLLSIYIQSNSGIDALDHEQDTNMVSIDDNNNVEPHTDTGRTYKKRGKGWRRGKRHKRTAAQKEERRENIAIKNAEQTE